MKTFQQVWKIEVYENGTWRAYGQPSGDFSKLYTMCAIINSNGTKARMVRVWEENSVTE